jgi:hypothetical protein
MFETTDDIRRALTSLVEMTSAATEADAIDRLTVLEELKSAATAAQVRETARLDELRAADEEARRVPQRRRGKGLGAEIGLARKASGRKGSSHLGFARALTREMPHTLAALAAGHLTEWRATILVRETAYLTRESRETIDRELCSDTAALDGVGDKELEAKAKELAYQLEPRAVVDRKAKVDKDRRVSVRPAPDLMTHLSALVPMVQGIAMYAALKKHADSLIGADDRTHAQIMADTLVERVTGQTTADAVPVAVNLIMSAETMLGTSDAPADIPGYGPIPAEIARRLILLGVDATTTSTIRRLYVRPADGTLVSMDARSRCFPKNLAHFISLRDQRCRVPYCDAPVEQIDHADPHRRGGATTAINGDGTCGDHNHSKEADGWTYTVLATNDGPHTLDIRTPTGHTYRSIAPPLIRPQPPAPQPAHPHPPIRRRPRRTTRNRTTTRRRLRSPI